MGQLVNTALILKDTGTIMSVNPTICKIQKSSPMTAYKSVFLWYLAEFLMSLLQHVKYSLKSLKILESNQKF